MPDKFSRICWNTNGWRKPSGSADETGGSFVAENGFGHEEWLFNYEWTLKGSKFAFLEPFRKTRHDYEGKTLDAALYTKFKTKQRTYTLLVGIIKQLYFPTLDELADAFKEIKSNGWLDQMRTDVAAVEGKPGPLASPKPQHLINVRFRPESVIRYDPMPMFPAGHIAARNKRYLASDWDGHALPAGASQTTTAKKSERELVRAAQQATTVDPKHSRLQNRLFETLCDRHGEDCVLYEDNCVDLKLLEADGDTFYEIKIESTAKKCIRSALGQLLEYSTYPNVSRANRLVIVGEAPATSDDVRYLKHLRNQFSMPIYYARFDWPTADLGDLT